ncbi:hypothetical protein [Arachnia propionica]|nr:hypothetical protein [Arachnia propionica]
MALHARISCRSTTVSDIIDVPESFNFVASPSGICFTVRSA